MPRLIIACGFFLAVITTVLVVVLASGIDSQQESPAPYAAQRDAGYAPTNGESTYELQVALAQEHAAAFSPLAAAPPFDLERFRADPEAYARQIIPGRIYQVAEAGEGVSQLIPASEQSFEIPRGQGALLSVQAEPFAPVTFHSFDLGAFENDYPTMTVLADANGLAKATFRATEATVADCAIKAASPLHVGQILFHVTIIN